MASSVLLFCPSCKRETPRSLCGLCGEMICFVCRARLPTDQLIREMIAEMERRHKAKIPKGDLEFDRCVS